MINLNGIEAHIAPFLLNNNFKKVDEFCYANDFCGIEIQKEGYAVCDNDGNTMYSNDHSIYWLVGYLTWSGYLIKDYIKN